jgi:DNA-binding transcriptional ArsR family regulator
MSHLSKHELERVADYFRALGDPTRLQILREIQSAERSVGELATICGCSSANISRHLALLGRQGLVARVTRGTAAYHRIADESTHELCNLVCGNIGRRLRQAADELGQSFNRPAHLAPERMPKKEKHHESKRGRD